ncbi:hypothetical protein PUR49_01355 [Streptomyces sp. BE147]|uniref:hypothetical protein n=1 Tax=Streptomyces sp. BE147 TaxID=3002524 RepID=UPI002E78C219|nr:hypothetical protein [Streptomyces sp. BE147]MEE1735192.1 hypothetical protein [Streptomyces sp. BE147]
MEARPMLCGDCDQRYDTDIEQAWPDEPRQEERDQEQEQAVPKQKAPGWLSRLRG